MARERGGPPARPRQPGDTLGMDDLREIVRMMQQSDIEEITIERKADDVRLQLRKPSQSAPLAALASAAHEDAALDGHDAAHAAEPVDVEDSFIRVTAQLVGRFHRGARPGAKPLVEEGAKVRQGQVLGTIETLNVLTEVEAPQAGRVAEVTAAEGQAVEYGQLLLRLEPLPA
ncbi:MAG TPA: acetyl-CoA carboxylase biotin carboxyl carrier protein subunit [Ktedonobacterales bacterium]|nr:acetyl-CoA carboxylase biotin carboxyl carrier protein subunit [Ktedonobacterales bacterium]